MTLLPQVGDAMREATEEDAAQLPPQGQTCVDLCGNCFHGFVCTVAIAVRQLTSATGNTNVSIGECSFYMPIEDEAEEEAAIEP